MTGDEAWSHVTGELSSQDTAPGDGPLQALPPYPPQGGEGLPPSLGLLRFPRQEVFQSKPQSLAVLTPERKGLRILSQRPQEPTN